jgi:hypothetical protein
MVTGEVVETRRIEEWRTAPEQGHWQSHGNMPSQLAAASPRAGSLRSHGDTPSQLAAPSPPSRVTGRVTETHRVEERRLGPELSRITGGVMETRRVN